jgi:hypothetical protein
MSIIIDTPLRNILRKITPRYIGYGSIDVEFPDGWYLQDTDGEFITDEQGNKIFTGCPGQPLLDTDGEPLLDSNGMVLYDTNYGAHGLGGYTSPYQLDSEGGILFDTQADAHPHYQTPLLETNWRSLLVDGTATQLDTLETTIQYVTIQAKFTNLGKIWIGNSNVRRDRGIHLLPNHPPITLNIDDLRKIYIIGNAGEGVTFLFGTNEDIYLTTPGGDFVTTPGGDLIG